MDEKEKIKKCETGCKAFYGGEIKHHPDCIFYPDSLSKKYDMMEIELQQERQAKKELVEALEDLHKIVCKLCIVINPQHKNCTSCNEMEVYKHLVNKYKETK
jgi:hypothetical protein